MLSRALLPPDNMTDPMLYDSQKGPLERNHNYTDCCISNNVSSSCFGFCNIQSILEGNTGQDPENCEKDFPAIVKCMAGESSHGYFWCWSTGTGCVNKVLGLKDTVASIIQNHLSHPPRKKFYTSEFSLLYRINHKSLRDFQTWLRNNQDRHGRKEHINR